MPFIWNPRRLTTSHVRLNIIYHKGILCNYTKAAILKNASLKNTLEIALALWYTVNNEIFYIQGDFYEFLN